MICQRATLPPVMRAYSGFKKGLPTPKALLHVPLKPEGSLAVGDGDVTIAQVIAEVVPSQVSGERTPSPISFCCASERRGITNRSQIYVQN